LNVLNFLGLWPVLDNLCFVVGYSETRRENNISQVSYQLRVKLTFLCFGIKTSLVETFKYFFNMLVMFRHVVQVGEYIIQIYYDTNIQKIRNKVIYELLKGYRNISKTKGHYRLLKWFIISSESSLLFITIGNANQMVSMAKIYLSMYLGFVRWIKQIRDEWERIMIFLKI